MDGADPKGVQDAADKIASLLSGKIKRDMNSLYGLVHVAAKSLQSTGEHDEQQIENLLLLAIKHALKGEDLPTTKSYATRELEQWEIVQLKQWAGRVPEC
jgi:hypothetical protein